MELIILCKNVERMNVVQATRPYEAPMAEVFFCPKPLSLLVSVSIEAGVEDWEEGEEL